MVWRRWHHSCWDTQLAKAELWGCSCNRWVRLYGCVQELRCHHWISTLLLVDLITVDVLIFSLGLADAPQRPWCMFFVLDYKNSEAAMSIYTAFRVKTQHSAVPDCGAVKFMTHDLLVKTFRHFTGRWSEDSKRLSSGFKFCFVWGIWTNSNVSVKLC